MIPRLTDNLTPFGTEYAPLYIVLPETGQYNLFRRVGYIGVAAIIIGYFARSLRYQV